MSGSIPAAIGSLTSLARLFLNDNALSGEIPAALDSLTSLKFLALDGDTGLCLAADFRRRPSSRS